MRLSSVVTVQDVSEAVRLMKVSMQQSSIDPRTGQIDMDLIQTGGWVGKRWVSGWVGGQGQCNL
jgi:DNA replication licensing factor MCM4